MDDGKIEYGLRKPVITNIDWIENGKIELSFRYIPNCKHNIHDFELYYCYITSNDNNWYQHASNNWRSIHIASKQGINKNIELRIATNKNIYDDNKNKNIELIMKIRCELKCSDWKWHSLMSEFSNIYYVQSMSIPSILNKQTQIDEIVNAIFNDNDNDKEMTKQKLISLYESFKDVYGVHNAFTKLIIKNIGKYYKLKCNQLLSTNINFISYLVEVEKFINHEKQSLFPCINQYIDDNKKQNIIKAMIDELFDTTNDLKIQQLIENKQIGINQLFVTLMTDQQNAIKDLDRLLTFYGLMTEETQSSFDIYISNVIEGLFMNENVNLSIFEMHNNISTILNKMNNATYNNSLTEALNNYLEKEDGILSIINKLHDGDDEKDQETAKQTMGELYALYSNVRNGHARIGKLLNIYIKQYYKQKSKVWLNDFDAKQYLINAQNCIKNEELLASYINHQQSCSSLITITREELLKYHQEELLSKQTGLNYMLQNTAKEDLSRLYELYSLIPDGLIKITQGFTNYIIEKGQQCINIMKKQEMNDEKSDDVSAASLFKLHDTMKDILINEFKNEQIFHKALKDAFEEFINRKYYTSAVLAKCAHNMLLKGSRCSEIEMEQTMDNIVTMYGYIWDKDIFERDYQQYFANRLLQNLYISDETEKKMMIKLKYESGYHWTSKLEDMLKDIQRSKELYQDFETQYVENNEDNDHKLLYVNVCTTGAWPTSSIQPVTKPMEIEGLSKEYKKYYLNRFSGRRLKFQCERGTAEIEVEFNEKTRKILICSTYQMMILLLFNKKNKWMNVEIANVTGILFDDLDKEIYPLNEMKIIIKTKQIKVDTHSMLTASTPCYEIEINSQFSSQWKKIRIPKIKPKKPRDEKGMEAIYRLRRHQMDAAIVRIMKARKTLKHPDLVTEIVRQLRGRFTPKPVDCKRRIANLIELEYLERDEYDTQLYHYKMR